MSRILSTSGEGGLPAWGVCFGGLLQGGSAPGGVWSQGGCLLWGASGPEGGLIPGGCLLRGGLVETSPGRLLLRAVCILLECILISQVFVCPRDGGGGGVGFSLCITGNMTRGSASRVSASMRGWGWGVGWGLADPPFVKMLYYLSWILSWCLSVLVLVTLIGAQDDDIPRLDDMNALLGDRFIMTCPEGVSPFRW